MKVETNGIFINYDTVGSEEGEPILLISGLGTQMIRWPVSFCDSLAARGFYVIRFDNRDAGLSTHFSESPVPDFGALSAAIAEGRQPDVPYTLRDMAADAVGLLDILGIVSAHLVGRSMGGMIAQMVASEYPHRVASLVSIMSSTGNPNLPSAAPDVMAQLMQRAPNPFEDEAGFLSHGLALARRISSPAYPFEEEAHSALILAEARRAYDPGGVGRQIAAIGAISRDRARLSDISTPTLVIHGASDPLIPPACGEDTASSIHESELMMIDGMGHDIPADLQQTVIDAIVRNCRRKPSTAVEATPLRSAPHL